MKLKTFRRKGRKNSKVKIYHLSPSMTKAIFAVADKIQEQRTNSLSFHNSHFSNLVIY